MYLYPTLIDNPKYKKNKKNGGVIPPITDERVKYVPIGCQKCIECRRQKVNMWRTRLLEEIKHNYLNAHFITLTFTDEALQELSTTIQKTIQATGYDLDNAIVTLSIRRWLERIRKTTGKSVKHWLIPEIGGNGTERIHIHGIIWTDNIQSILNKWNNGRTVKGKYVNERTVNYIVKYMQKEDTVHKNYIPKIHTSPGIGAGYINTYNAGKNKYNGKETKATYTTRDGTTAQLPIYYKNKLYTDDEREKLWLHLLDKTGRTSP